MHNSEKTALAFGSQLQASSSSNELHFPPDMRNGILRLYNQFPRCYNGGIDEMTAQLPAIKQMGFNAVWINPIQLTGTKEVTRIYDQVSDNVKGSLYAMADDRQFNPTFQVDEQKIIAYTQQARDLGLIPMFDLVLNQVAADEGTPIMKAFKDYLAYKTKEGGSILWDDTMFFQYHDKNPANYPTKHPDNYQVIVNFWKEFITRYIEVYGFRGVRVDALTELGIKDKKQHGNRRKKKPEEFFDESKRNLYWQLELQREIYEHVKACCEKKRYKPVILGELFCKTPTIFVNSLKGIGLTHINNSVFYANFSKEGRKNDKQEDKDSALRGWNASNWVLHQLSSLKQIMHSTHSGNNISSPVGGTIGYVGNHDVMSLAASIEKKNDRQIANSENILSIKERIASVAFTSDSGWYMLCGDEFGLKSYKPMVFDNFPKEDSLFKKMSCLEKWGSNIDLSQFIANINYVLSQLPATQLGDWVDHIAVEDLSNLVTILRYRKYDNRDIPDMLIFVDLSDKPFDPNIQKENPIKLLPNTSLKGEDIKQISKVFWVASDKVIIYNSHNGEPEKTWNWDVKSEPEPISSNTKDTDLNTMEMSNAN